MWTGGQTVGKDQLKIIFVPDKYSKIIICTKRERLLYSGRMVDKDDKTYRDVKIVWLGKMQLLCLSVTTIYGLFAENGNVIYVFDY